jgi:TPR repeat protein
MAMCQTVSLEWPHVHTASTTAASAATHHYDGNCSQPVGSDGVSVTEVPSKLRTCSRTDPEHNRARTALALQMSSPRHHPAGMAAFKADSAAVGAALQPAHWQAEGGVAVVVAVSVPVPRGSAAADSVFLDGQRLYSDQRYSVAAQRWGQAALSKHAASHAFLSDMLVDGRPGVAKDAKRAFELAQAGAALGCAHSKGVLGRCYFLGLGVAQDIKRALELGRESEAAGSCFGQFLLGLFYDQGLGVAQDFAEAVRLFRLATAQGHAPAADQLAFMFSNGLGVAMDLAEAERLLDLALEQGLDREALEIAEPIP